MKFILITLFWAISFCSFAVENTGRLYRVDTRGPDEIFNNGFHSFGDNDNLRDHSRGASCTRGDQTSAFISVSADPEYAATYARRLLQHVNQPVYVYIINSTQNMYNMATSLRNIDYQTGIRDAEIQSEWVALGGIAREDVIGVRAYTGADTPSIRYNPHSSLDRQPVINPEPFRTAWSARRPGAVADYARLTPPVTACMAATLYCTRHSKSYSGDGSCSYLEPLNPKIAVLLDE